MKTPTDMSDRGKGGGGKAPSATTPTVNAANGDQISMLLHVAAALAPYLMTRGNENLDESVDKESRLAASVTFINALDRLDNMIAEDARWSVAPYDAITKSLKDMYDAQTDYFTKAAATNEGEKKRLHQYTRPSTVRRPSLYVLNDGTYMMCDGDPSDSSTMKAIGDSPEAAAVEFDTIYNGAKKYEPFAVQVTEDAPTTKARKKDGPAK